MNIDMLAYVFLLVANWQQTSGSFVHPNSPRRMHPNKTRNNPKSTAIEQNLQSRMASIYPNCTASYPETYIGDGQCHGGTYNTEECGWDGGDCIEFNTNYPNCTVDSPYFIGNGYCGGWEYNTEECGWDGGDCIEFNEKYPDCHVDYPQYIDPQYIGGGICHHWKTGYNTEECGWDGGDCLIEGHPDCHVVDYWKIGDGKCHYWEKEYNSLECGYDGGDCIPDGYPDCHVDFPEWIGDGECQAEISPPAFIAYNTSECGYDGGDCLI